MRPITVRAAITADDFFNYMHELDRLELPYSFVLDSEALNDPMVLELWVDGSDHNGTNIRLKRDGTWTTTTVLTLGHES